MKSITEIQNRTVTKEEKINKSTKVKFEYAPAGRKTRRGSMAQIGEESYVLSPEPSKHGSSGRYRVLINPKTNKLQGVKSIKRSLIGKVNHPMMIGYARKTKDILNHLAGNENTAFLHKMKDDFRLVMPHIEGLTLHQHLKAITSKSKLSKLMDVIPWFLEAAQVLDEKIHEKKVVHADVKANNIMVNTKGEIVYIDFDYGNFLGEEIDTFDRKKPVTLEYLPPERLNQPYPKIPAKFSVDVYSFGAMVIDYLEPLLKGERYPTMKSITQTLISQLNTTLNADPKLRPPMKDVVQIIRQSVESIMKYMIHDQNSLSQRLNEAPVLLFDTLLRVARGIKQFHELGYQVSPGIVTTKLGFNGLGQICDVHFSAATPISSAQNAKSLQDHDIELFKSMLVGILKNMSDRQNFSDTESGEIIKLSTTLKELVNYSINDIISCLENAFSSLNSKLKEKNLVTNNLPQGVAMTATSSLSEEKSEETQDEGDEPEPEIQNFTEVQSQIIGDSSFFRLPSITPGPDAVSMQNPERSTCSSSSVGEQSEKLDMVEKASTSSGISLTSTSS